MMTFEEYLKRMAKLAKEQRELIESSEVFKQNLLQAYYNRKDQILSDYNKEIRAAEADYEKQLREHNQHRLQRNQEIEFHRQWLAREFKKEGGNS